MPPVSLLVKPVSDLCGLRCEYCFYRDLGCRSEAVTSCVMDDSTLESVIGKALCYAEERCTFAFQGGEPTLAGLPFFERAVQLQRKYAKPGITVHNVLQTNGMHLDRTWTEFLSENRFLVGLSLDGTKSTHDRFRRTADAQGSFERVMESVRLLDEALVPYNILTVVTAPLAAKAQAVYAFYRKHGFDYLQFIPCLDALDGRKGPWSLKPGEYAHFLCAVFDLWYADFLAGRYINIRYFENLVGALMGCQPETCGLSGRCAKQLVVEADGSVYPCDFYVMPEYRMGNIRTHSVEELLADKNGSRFVDESSAPRLNCRGCQWYALCRGGCRRDCTAGERGLKNRLCKDYRLFFAHAYPKLAALAAQLKH